MPATFSPYTAEEKQQAYLKGKQDARRVDGRTLDVPNNPYGRRTVLGREYTAGWNTWVAKKFS